MGQKKGAIMKKIFYLVVVVVALGILVSAGILWAGQTAPVCPSHGSKCFERDGDCYCNSYEAVQTNKLVRGRAGQLEYVRVPVSELKIQKCAEMGHGIEK